MCNWCSNAITFASKDFNALKELHNHIYAIYKSHDNTVAGLLASYAYTEHDVRLLSNRTDYFDWVDNRVSQKGDVFFFEAFTVSRWTPNMEALDVLIHEKYKGKIKLYYQSEEEGCEIYVYRDETCSWYPERYKCDYSQDEDGDSGCEYFNTYAELVDFVKANFPKAKGVSPFCSLSENERAVCDAYEGEDDFYFNIYAFRPDAKGYQAYEEVA